MKKLLALTLVCSVVSGCSYLGAPESYTVVEENVAPAPVVAPAPTVLPCGGVYCAAHAPRCGCANKPCQINPGVAGPLVVSLPGQAVVVQ